MLISTLLKGTLAVLNEGVASLRAICCIYSLFEKEIWIFCSKIASLTSTTTQINLPQYPRWVLLIDLFLKCSVFVLNGISSAKHNGNALSLCTPALFLFSLSFIHSRYHLPSTMIMLPRRACSRTKADNKADTNGYTITSYWFFLLSTQSDMWRRALAETHQSN